MTATEPRPTTTDGGAPVASVEHSLIIGPGVHHPHRARLGVNDKQIPVNSPKCR